MKKAMIFGNGVSGKGAQRLLHSLNYEVIMVDDKTGVTSSDAVNLLDDINIFIKSPGISFDAPLVAHAINKKVEVIDEIELGYRYMKEGGFPIKLIGITGTNGKTTVTSKITELLNLAGYKAFSGGNIGVSFCALLLDNKEVDYIVLELSSFQLEGIVTFTPDISILINLSPDHLDRHKNMEEYYEAKFNICKNQTNKNIFLYNLNDKNTINSIKRKFSSWDSNMKLLGVSSSLNEAAFVYSENNNLICNKEIILDTTKLSLPGKHNLENSLFIVGVGRLLDISVNTIQKCLYNTKALEHRMEVFYKWGNNIFINDSKGTNLDSSIFAIEAYKGAILICGGKEKGLPLEEISLSIKNNISKVYLIGEMASRFYESLLAINYPKEKIFNLKTLENVIFDLKNTLDLNSNKFILLSPATSSFDQFKSYEYRGLFFKELIKNAFSEGEEL